MVALPTALGRRRFELFHSALVICGLVIAADPLVTLLSGRSTDSVLFAALGVATGVGFVGWGLWTVTHRDRESWEDEVEGYALAIWTVIAVAAFFVGAAIYVALSVS